MNYFESVQPDRINPTIFYIQIQFQLYLSLSFMILAIFSRFPAFSTVKYIIKNKKYLIPEPPKRPLSNYILFSMDLAKKKVQGKQGEAKVTIDELSKAASQKWSSISPEEKKKYEDKAKELKDKNAVEKALYEAKYVNPFKTVTLRTYFMQQFYKNNKEKMNFADGVKAFTEHYNKLAPEDKEKGQKAVDQINKKNLDLIKHFEIPLNPYTNFASFYRAEKKKNPNLPKQSQLSQKVLAKMKKDFENECDQYALKLKTFASTFGMKGDELVKLLNAQKPEAEKLNEEGRSLKQISQKMIQQRNKQVKKVRKEKSQEIKKLKLKHKKEQQRLIKKSTLQIQKKKLGARRVKTKLQTKIEKVEREIAIEKVNAETEKALAQKTLKPKRSKKAATSAPTEAPKQETQATEAPVTQTNNQVKA